MKEANKYIFGELADFVEHNQIDVVIDRQKKRCIETNDEDKEWLKSLKVIDEKYHILPNFQTASFQYDGNDYFVTIGVQEYLETNQEEEVIQFLELNAGIVTALLFELKISVNKKVNPYKIRDEIFYPSESESEDEIIPYEFSKVKDFFEPIFVYKIPENSPFLSLDKINITRISGFCAVKSSQLISLKFSSDTLNQFEKLFIEGSKNIPYESLLFSLVSVSWKYSFLDIYRCIERLFPISALEDLHKKLNLNIKCSLLDFADDIESYIGWKPKENEALNKLINNSPDTARQILRQVKADIEGTKKGNLGNFIYKIRNSIVHFRPATEQIKLDDNNWNRLINSSLLVIEYWYAKYEPQLTDSNFSNDES
ncbi:MAG: hypothetical protein F6K40_26965 [Okeania sp. SIO3I5]|uniref:hypothetical protein n=1 Tax=Okeania sp. SIO3I5 TaxID=2607805 RepID=UPI0013BE05A5|nr:hypothetical protein [Okeania sp. SIO3I5]NEQ39696.1 hypothetical protein [Okeania sp. SIO3I5]